MPDPTRPDAALPGSPDALRAAMGRFASSVTVASALDGDGTAHALTATAVCSVSLDPPLVLLCVGHASRFHPVVLAAGAWTVSVLAADQGAYARHFAAPDRDLATQFAGIPHRSAPHSGAPVLDGARAWLDLRTVAAHEAGDHTILVGQVLAVGVDAGGPAPLTYDQGSYSDAPTGPPRP